MRTQVATVGGGRSGLLLSQLLNRAGIATVVLERKSRNYVLSRNRAGMLDWTTVKLLRRAGVGARMDLDGIVHDDCHLSDNGAMFRVDFRQTCGQQVMVYGQTKVTRNLYDAQAAIGATIIHDAEEAALHDLGTDRPHVTYRRDGVAHRLDCDHVPDWDGYYGVSRRSIPVAVRREYEKVYPSGWLGVLSRTPPVSDELIYASHDQGIALALMRNPMLSRWFVQVPLTDRVADWTDKSFWNEFRARMAEVAARLVTPVAGKIHRPPAVVCHRADALGSPVPVWRCRPYRPADRGQGAEPCPA